MYFLQICNKIRLSYDTNVRGLKLSLFDYSFETAVRPILMGRTAVLVVESSFSFAKEVLGVFSVVANGFWFAKEVLGQFSAFENGFWLAKEVLWVWAG